MSPLDLHVERDGRRGAPAVMLLHGFTGSTRIWDDLRARLREHHDVLAVDLPGHGASPVPPDPRQYRLERVSDDLAHLLDRAGVARCAVLGYSMGGRQALRFTLANPHRVTHLILESTTPGIPDAAERDARRRRDDEMAAFIEREGVEAFVQHWEQMPMWATQSSLDAGARARQRAIRLSHSATGLANALRGAGQGLDEPGLHRLAGLTMPVLLIVGALDEAYREHAERMLRALPSPVAELHLVESAGHAVHLEQPDAYATAVLDFLRR